MFGQDRVVVTSVRLDEDDNPMLALVTADDQARCCPSCGVRSTPPALLGGHQAACLTRGWPLHLADVDQAALALPER